MGKTGIFFETAVLALDREGRILCSNAPAARWLGRSEGALPEELQSLLGLRNWDWAGGEASRLARLQWRNAAGREMDLQVETALGELGGLQFCLVVLQESTNPEQRVERARPRVPEPGEGGGRMVAAQGHPGRANPSGGGRILVVDDEELVRKVLVAILASRGYEVTAAASGGEAIQLVAEGPRRFDLVLMDLNMPDLNGREALLGIRELSPELPAILLSGELEEGERGGKGRLGNVEFLQKPFDNQELLRRVKARVAGVPPG